MQFTKTALTVGIAIVAAAAIAQDKLNGKPVPNFTMKDLSGRTITNKDLKGKVVLIDFWATWCGPCKKASPTMQALHKKYAGKGLVVLGAQILDPGGDAAKYAKEHNYTYRFTTGGESLHRATGARGIPTFMFINRQGVVEHVQMGWGDRLAKDFEKRVEALLAKK